MHVFKTHIFFWNTVCFTSKEGKLGHGCNYFLLCSESFSLCCLNFVDETWLQNVLTITLAEDADEEHSVVIICDSPTVVYMTSHELHRVKRDALLIEEEVL